VAFPQQYLARLFNESSYMECATTLPEASNSIDALSCAEKLPR
jgi:hypothetical protein